MLHTGLFNFMLDQHVKNCRPRRCAGFDLGAFLGCTIWDLITAYIVVDESHSNKMKYTLVLATCNIT